MADPLGPPPGLAEPEFSRGRLLPAAAAGCALPVVAILLALLLGLGLVVWSGTRPTAQDAGDAPGTPAASTTGDQAVGASDR
ncbi:MAG: hypothetical protein ACFCVF_12860 [Kineosporiaceae bacterium]